MVWDANAPPFVDALKDALAACPTWISEFASVYEVEAHIHYPDADLDGEYGPPDLLPLMVITQEGGKRKFIADGVTPLRDATLHVDLFVSASSSGAARTVAQLETLADNIIGELLAIQPRILPIGDVSFDMATDPSVGTNATDADGTASAYRCLRISIPLGYNI